jgi:hypothetical protein
VSVTDVRVTDNWLPDRRRHPLRPGERLPVFADPRDDLDAKR